MLASGACSCSLAAGSSAEVSAGPDSSCCGAGHVLGVFAQGPTLTTKDQASGPTLLVDENGNEVTIKGIGWYGFNTG